MRTKEIVGSTVAVPPDRKPSLAAAMSPALVGELRRQPSDRPAARTTLSGPLSSPGRVAVAAGGKSGPPAQSSKVEFCSTWSGSWHNEGTSDFTRSPLADSRRRSPIRRRGHILRPMRVTPKGLIAGSYHGK